MKFKNKEKALADSKLIKDRWDKVKKQQARSLKRGCYIWLPKMVSSLSPTPKTKLKGVWQTGKSVSKQTKWRANSLQLKRKISNYTDTKTDMKCAKDEQKLAWLKWMLLEGGVRSWPIFPLMESHIKTFHGGLFTSTPKSLKWALLWI